jgi:hypothetical protein
MDLTDVMGRSGIETQWGGQPPVARPVGGPPVRPVGPAFPIANPPIRPIGRVPIAGISRPMAGEPGDGNPAASSSPFSVDTWLGWRHPKGGF